MTVQAIGPRRGRSLKAALLTWVWPQPLDTEERGGAGWLAALLGWMWPSAVHDERPGARHGLMAALFGWLWPSNVDNGFKRFWKLSWLWSWMWPGRVLGPDGEICALAPWHPAVRPEVCIEDPWYRRVGKHGGMVFMMFAATAIAAPTFMEGTGVLDAGRLNLFRSGGDAGQGGGAADPGAGVGGGAGDP
ncbi:hypothetical protein, partial [Phenylobacterium sp.]|uniref:hypothetical protein n=1 Tax=Phenylobacterium sp. TaxID=1871053 RepID=UPI0025F3A03D